MQVGLHLAKIWAVHVFVALGVVAGLGYSWAIVDEDWRDRLSGDVHAITVTVVGEHRNDFGCGSKYQRPGWDWEVTWTEDGRTRSGDLDKCGKAPAVGTEVDTYLTGSGKLGGTSAGNYYLWWVLVSLGLGTLLTPLWLRSRGKAAWLAVREEAGR